MDYVSAGYLVWAVFRPFNPQLADDPTLDDVAPYVAPVVAWMTLDGTPVVPRHGPLTTHGTHHRYVWATHLTPEGAMEPWRRAWAGTLREERHLLAKIKTCGSTDPWETRS